MAECQGCSLCCIRCGMELHSELYNDLPAAEWPEHTCAGERACAWCNRVTLLGSGRSVCDACLREQAERWHERDVIWPSLYQEHGGSE